MNLDEAIALIRKRWPGVVSEAKEEPVFVLAAGWRSGSTMLQRMLLSKCLMWGEPYGSSGLIERLAQPLRRFAPNWPAEEYFLSNGRWGEHLGEQWTANLYPPMQHLLVAHVAFLRTLFGEPSRQRGYERWGLKEVRYGMEHAIYLRWLFPQAKFLFLVRNPYDCWASYRRAGSRVLRFWPEDMITTPEQFGGHWVSLARGFWQRASEVKGVVVRYESLGESNGVVQAIEEHVGFKLDLVAQKVMVGASPPGSVQPEEMDRLETIVAPLANTLGYFRFGAQTK